MLTKGFKITRSAARQPLRSLSKSAGLVQRPQARSYTASRLMPASSSSSRISNASAPKSSSLFFPRHTTATTCTFTMPRVAQRPISEPHSVRRSLFSNNNNNNNIHYQRNQKLSAASQPRLLNKAHSSVRRTSGLLPSSRLTMPFNFEREIMINVPFLGDSITDGRIEEFVKQPGDWVEADEVVATIETDKVVVNVNAPEPGLIKELKASPGDTVKVEDPVFELDTTASRPSGGASKKPEAKAEKKTEKKAEPAPAAPKAEKKAEPAPAAPAPPKAAAAPPKAAAPVIPSSSGPREHRVLMTRQRARTAERLKDSQNTYALLTTFNELDMTNLMDMKNQFKDAFFEKHGVKLGFMSTFLKASATALQENPVINAVIDGDSIVYRDYVDVSVAVATPTGLAVPVLRDVQGQTLADLERNLTLLGQKARDRKLEMSDMVGGTFTISNGGVYGSLMGTPIVNPPQSAILGMHGVFNRPVAVNNQVVIRPMMYIALTYDHRLIDGRDAVLFLRRVKDLVEDPRRLLIA